MKIIPTIYIVYLENVNFPIKCTIIGHYRCINFKKIKNYQMIASIIMQSYVQIPLIFIGVAQDSTY